MSRRGVHATPYVHLCAAACAYIPLATVAPTLALYTLLLVFTCTIFVILVLLLFCAYNCASIQTLRCPYSCTCRCLVVCLCVSLLKAAVMGGLLFLHELPSWFMGVPYLAAALCSGPRAMQRHVCAIMCGRFLMTALIGSGMVSASSQQRSTLPVLSCHCLARLAR